MSLELPFGLKVLNPLPVDDKYLNNGTPYANSAAVLAAIPQSIRHVGLTVNIANIEYWFKDGVTDLDLILKSAGFTLVNGSGTTVNGGGDGINWHGTITQNTVITDASGYNISFPGTTGTFEISRTYGIGSGLVTNFSIAPGATTIIEGEFGTQVLVSAFTSTDFDTFSTNTVDDFDGRIYLAGSVGEQKILLRAKNIASTIDSQAVLTKTGYSLTNVSAAYSTSFILDYSLPENIKLSWNDVVNGSYNKFSSSTDVGLQGAFVESQGGPGTAYVGVYADLSGVTTAVLFGGGTSITLTPDTTTFVRNSFTEIFADNNNVTGFGRVTFYSPIVFPNVASASLTDYPPAQYEGAILYNTTTNVLNYSNGSAWQAIGGASSYTFQSGLTESTGTVVLGGQLLQNTVLETSLGYTFEFENQGARFIFTTDFIPTQGSASIVFDDTANIGGIAGIYFTKGGTSTTNVLVEAGRYSSGEEGELTLRGSYRDVVIEALDVGSALFDTYILAGTLYLGKATHNGILRTISAINSTNDASLTITAQGAILIDGQNGQITINPYFIEFAGGLYVNASITGGSPTYGAGEGVVFIRSASVNPGSNPTGGGILYGDLSDSHKLKWRTPDGTVYDLTTTGGGSGYATIQEEGTPLTQRFVLNFTSNGITAVDDAGNSRTNVSLNATLTAFANYNSDGILTQTAANTFVGRTITGTTNRIAVTDGDGVAGQPTIDVGANIIDKSVTNTYTAGAKQIFSHSATTAGINIAPVAGAPSTPANGDLWVDDTLKDFYLYVNGSPYALTRNPVKDVPGTTYTFLESDRGKILRFTDASGCTANAPNGLSLDWSVIVYRAVGAGVLTFTATSTFIEGAGTTLDTEATMAAIHQRGSNTFIISGAVGASSGPAFGSVAQIPFMNGGGTNFSYEAGFEYNETTNVLYVPNSIMLGGGGITGSNRSVTASSSGTDCELQLVGKGTGSSSGIGIFPNGFRTILFRETSSSVASMEIQQNSSSGNPGRTFTLSGSTGNGTNQNGGNLIFKSGAKTGTGLDGKIILDPLLGWVEMPNTTSIGTVTADYAAMYVSDIAAGNAAFHFKTELGQVIKLYQVNAGSAYTVTNGTTDRTFDANSYTTDELADVLYSLITDLKLTNIIA
jgi:hypothetical protein